MRMADRDSRRIGSIIWLGNCWQVEQLTHHVADLLFARSPIACHRQLHFARRVLGNRESLLRQRQNRDTARLRHLDGRGHVPAEEQCLDGCLCWLVLGDDRAQLLIDAAAGAADMQASVGVTMASQTTRRRSMPCADRTA